MGSGVTPFYHTRTFTFFLPGTGKTQRNISEALVPLFFFSPSLQIDIFLKSRLEIWHGHNFVRKISFLLPVKQITNVLAYPFLSPLSFLLKQIRSENPLTSEYHLLSPLVPAATVMTVTIKMLPQC